MILPRRHFLGSALAGAALAGFPVLRTSSAQAQEVPKQGKRLRIAVIGSAADTLDGAAYVTTADQLRAQQLYDGLAETDDKFEVKLSLAEEITMESPSSWLIRLKEGLTFHNGKTVSAEDVIFSIQRIIDPKKPYQGSQGLVMIDFNGMKALDKRTVRLKLNSPNSYLVEELTQIWNPIVPTDFDVKNPVGTGPYKFKSFQPGRQSVFVRNEAYWREAPYAEELVVIDFAEDNARLNALLAGQVDIVPVASHAQLPIAQAAPNVKVFNQPSARWEPVCMRADTAPFNDERVRQALRLVVDRKQMVQQVYNGNARLGNDLFGAMDAEYASHFPQREQDIDQAKSLLKAAGASDLKLEIVTTPLSSTLVQSAEVYAQQAAKAGVSVNVRRIDPSSFFGPDYLKRPFTQDHWGNFPIEPLMSLTVLKGAGNNETSWYDEPTNKLVDQARAATDKGSRKQIMFDLQKVLYDRGGYVIPALINEITLYSSKLAGFELNPTGNTDFKYQFRRIGFAK